MSDILQYLKEAVELNTSDIFIGAGRCIAFKVDGYIKKQSSTPLNVDEANDIITQLYGLAKRSMDNYLKTGDDDFSVSIPHLARFRISAYQQRGTKAAAIRIVNFDLPDFRQLQIPEEVMAIAGLRNGLALVTGPTGSGKSTTLACIINAINENRNSHIITLEDPIEYIHRDKQSLISQREVSSDTNSYLTALRAAMRQSPDVILLGELRDYETIRAAITAAETGHLVISTLHTLGAANSIDRIIDVFPAGQQQQVRVQLSMILQAVVSQQLIPDKSGSLFPVFEIMRMNNAIGNLIRESKIHQIDGMIQTSKAEGMISIDSYIFDLYKEGTITEETALAYCVNTQQMTKRLSAGSL